MWFSCHHCKCHSVMWCHMLYSCSCYTVAATVYTTVLCIAACCTVVHVVQLLPFCMPVFCVAKCRTVATTETATVYATVLCVAACRAVAHVAQLLPLCMPQCSVLLRAVQLLMLYSCCHCVCQCSVLPHTVQLLMLYSCCHFVCQCSVLPHAMQLPMLYSCYNCVCHSVMCCHMPYSCCHYVGHSIMCCRICHTAASCGIIAAILYASVRCCHIPYSCSCCTVATTVYATVLCCHHNCVYHSVMCCRLPYSFFMLYSCCHCVHQFSALLHAVQFLHVVQLLPFCTPVFCVVMCHTAAATVYATRLRVTVATVLPHVIQLLHVIRFLLSVMCCCMLYSCCHCVCQYSVLLHAVPQISLQAKDIGVCACLRC